MKQIIPALLLLWLCASVGFAAEPRAEKDPRSLSIYQIMVASFQHGEGGAPGYTKMWGPDNARKDGNIRGIINSVDYIDSLGVNAVWLTPVFDSTKALYDDPKLNATGYFTNDYFSVDPNFGTDAELREMIDRFHEKGIMVILDGVFGHHGGALAPSPSGNLIDNTPAKDVRGYDAPVSYPGSLEYYKEVAAYWIDSFNIDGWRLDQAYQVCQNGKNYWKEIRRTVEETAARRAAAGEEWGTLGYMVGEDWGGPEVINAGVYKDLGLVSAFDFDGRERIVKLENPFDDIRYVYSLPTARGYCSDSVMPNLFLSNHDLLRVGDFIERDSLYFPGLMMRHAILAAYPGPITLYYGDEYGDDTRDAVGGQPDNIARTSGHLQPRDASEKALREYVSALMRVRGEYPAMWRGNSRYEQTDTLLSVIRTDPRTGERLLLLFPLTDQTVALPSGAQDLLGNGEVRGDTASLSALVPAIFKI